MQGLRRCVVVAVVAAGVIGAAGCIPPKVDQPIDPLLGSVAPESQLIGCDHATERLTIAVSSHLDPSCTYTLGADVTASNVVFDCRGAHIERDPADTENNRGIFVTAPHDIALTNVTVRNCLVKDFSNNLRVHRDDVKDLPEGQEYDGAFSDVRVENSHFYDSTASGVYVDAFVTGVTLDDIEVSGSGSVGVYLEAGSKDNVIEDSTIHHNGFGDVTPGGVPLEVNGVPFTYQSTGREGIAVDGSRNNVVRNNWIAANSAGGIFLYKNCGEDATNKPNAHWVRRYGANGNLIEGNVISAEKNGVWVSSRAAENQYFMDCSDPAYVTGSFRRVYLDPAKQNTIRANTFVWDTYAVRVEDDDAAVQDNSFMGGNAASQAVTVGTKERTNVLAQPVNGTVITGNRSTITGNASPYTWIWGETSTTYSGNLANGVASPLAPGMQPTINLFLFAISFAPA